MVRYIKVRPYVARKLEVEDVRYHYPDGNVLLWDKELDRVDPAWAFHPEEVVARIGGFMMDPYRNREEQQKTAEECTPLPIPTDPEWMDPEEAALLAAAVEEAVEEAIVEETGELLSQDSDEVNEEGGEP